jgi:DNA-binding LacI/PurR family transcriptional regulator
MIEKAVEMLTAQIDGAQDLAGTLVLDPSFTIRESTATRFQA